MSFREGRRPRQQGMLMFASLLVKTQEEHRQKKVKQIDPELCQQKSSFARATTTTTATTSRLHLPLLPSRSVARHALRNSLPSALYATRALEGDEVCFTREPFPKERSERAPFARGMAEFSHVEWKIKKTLSKQAHSFSLFLTSFVSTAWSSRRTTSRCV